MTAEDTADGFALAPVGIVRAALFPVSKLLSLEDRAIAQAAVDDRNDGYENAYAAAIERQRALLAETTLADLAFMRALAVTNPAFARRVTTKGPTAAIRNKKVRHAETTLYRYLARAVCRTEPCDLWAGFGLVRWAEATQVAQRPATYSFGPDLRPFIWMFRRLAERPDYRAIEPYFINPTLARGPAGTGWRYTARMEGAIFERAFGGGFDTDRLIERLSAMRPAPIVKLAGDIAGQGAGRDRIVQVLEILAEAGILVGGLTFPNRFASVWGALRLAEARLQPQDAACWRDARRGLRSLCRRLDATIENMTADQLLAEIDATGASIRTLSDRLDLDPPPVPRAPLRCDTRLPFAVELGSDDHRRWAAAVADYEGFERDHGLDFAARAAHRRAILRDPLSPPRMARSSTAGVPTLEAACAGIDPVLTARAAAWSSWIESEGGRAPAGPVSLSSADLSPVGALLVRPRSGLNHIVGSTPEVGALYGRYWSSWAKSGDMPAARRLHQWYNRALSSASAAAGVTIVEYAGPCDDAPNALARPGFGHRVWNRWDPRTCDVSCYEMPEGTDRALAFCQAEPGSAVSVYCFSPLNLGYSEPRLERLFLSSFREIPSWLSQGLPLAAELRSGGVSSGVVLRDGFVLREPRSILRGEWLSRFKLAQRPERFCMWQTVASAQGWPPIVLVSRGVEPSIPVVRDSPLALEAAMEGLKPDETFLTVIASEPHAWIADERSQAYAAEFSFPYTRTRHAWSDLAAG